MVACTVTVLSSNGSNPETIAYKHQEVTDTAKHDTQKHDTQRKGYLEPNDNQLDSVLTLPKELFAHASYWAQTRALGKM